MLYAMKRVKVASLNSKERENALNEVRILSSIQHNNLIAFKESFFEEETKTLNLVMEYADDGDIETKIKKVAHERKLFTEEDVWSFLIQTISGLKSLHDNKIMHRDLKSANLFLTKDKHIKLGDLNVSKFIKKGMAYTQTGTPYYASPEVWADKPYDYKSDIWSVGCIIYEICCLKPPFRAKSLESLYKCVSKGYYDPIPNVFSAELSRVISLMLQTNPTKRPTCSEILNLEEVKKRMSYDQSMNNFKFTSNKGGMPSDIETELAGTIKLRNINDIKQSIPKKKNYSLDDNCIDMQRSRGTNLDNLYERDHDVTDGVYQYESIVTEDLMTE
eukprot:CAMPEP_0170537268 /NCGR_PEP_ID=MMETSP0209-20121228/102615_1 /TAXON_ID=665100 ORGANISM="Litonotus pictus, Strain P1" /NCGR_SAMPLE_ID=MMETSP0209 /ASSEMBLY_ACC=CAM_ASM_000301 /LENGTH=330 /DNA_ID=CAMNT_0010838737 /DNA_START=12 /DNA_END=1005 /DNA_ORIENTATION=+